VSERERGKEGERERGSERDQQNVSTHGHFDECGRFGFDSDKGQVLDGLGVLPVADDVVKAHEDVLSPSVARDSRPITERTDS
jgi:hypothetical protein